MNDVDCKNCGVQIKLPIKPEPIKHDKPMALNKEKKQWECVNGPDCHKEEVLCENCKD